MKTRGESAEPTMNFVRSETLDKFWKLDQRSSFPALEPSNTEKRQERFAVPVNIYSHGIRTGISIG